TPSTTGALGAPVPVAGGAPQPSGSFSEPFCIPVGAPDNEAERVPAAAAAPTPMDIGAIGTADVVALVAAAMALPPTLATVLTPVVATEPATCATWVAALATPGLFAIAAAA